MQGLSPLSAISPLSSKIEVSSPKEEIVEGHVFSDDDQYQNNDSCCDEFGVHDGDKPIKKSHLLKYKAMALRYSST